MHVNTGLLPQRAKEIRDALAVLDRYRQLSLDEFLGLCPAGARGARTSWGSRLVPAGRLDGVASGAGKEIRGHRVTTGVSFHPRRARNSARRRAVPGSSTVQVAESMSTP